MSMTVVPKNKKVSWMPNIAGGQICGWIHVVSSIPVYFTGVLDDPHMFEFPHIPDSASKSQAQNWAKQIRYHLLNKTEFAQHRLYGLRSRCSNRFEGNNIGFRNYVAEYADFLEQCEGYRLI